MIFDLHCHTDASDGALRASELMRRARDRGVDVLSITDHDTIAAYAHPDFETIDGLQIVPGIEFSTHWHGHSIHVVGLGIDLDNSLLAEAVECQRLARERRAIEIGRRLERAGIENALDGARELAGNSAIGRPHFARFLVESGRVGSTTIAFRKYLGPGKPGDVRHFWPELETVTEWVTTAGGIAVLAHPAKYRMTNTKLGLLVDDFREYGGRAVEVLCGRQPHDLTKKLTRLCNRYEMLASCGSDFHAPGQGWSELGACGPLPDDCRPVWESLPV